MSRRAFRRDIPIRSAVVVWQPAFLARRAGGASPGLVSVLQHLDTADRAFAMSHGACVVGWAEQSEATLIETLNFLRGDMIDDYGIDPRDIDAAFATIPEYRRRPSVRRSAAGLDAMPSSRTR